MSCRRSVLGVILATLAAGSIAFAGPAAASGGGGGKGGGASSPAPPASVPCSPLVGTIYPDGTVAGDFNLYGMVGGCAVIQFHDDFTATVEQVLPEDGWTYQLQVRTQTKGTRVKIEYTEAATGRRTSMQVERGKTVIKQ